MALRVVDLLEVHADDDGRVEWLRALAGRGDDHLAGARLEMLRGAGPSAIAAGGLDHDIHPELAPRQLGDLRLGHRADRACRPIEQLADGGLDATGKAP